MDVLLDAEPLVPPLTGVGRYTLEIFKGLQDHPQVGRVYCFAGFGLKAPAFLPEPSGDGEPKNRWLRSAWIRRGLQRIPGSYRFREAVRDLFFLRAARCLNHCIYHGPNYVLKAFEGPKVVTVHDLSHLRYPQCHPEERVRHLVRCLEVSMGRADKVLTVSHFTKSEIMSLCGVPENKIAVVPLGVGEGFHPRAPEALSVLRTLFGVEPQGYLLCVSTLEPRKNIGGLLHAYERLPENLKKRFPLVIVGPVGWKSAGICRRLETLSERGHVRWLRYVPQRELELLYAGARAFAYVSFYEGFGLPPLEAMASGIPVMVSTAGALREVVGNTGLQVDPHDGTAMSEGLERILTDEGWRAQAVLRGLERAATFTWQACVDGTVRIYKEVGGGSEHP